MERPSQAPCFEGIAQWRRYETFYKERRNQYQERRSGQWARPRRANKDVLRSGHWYASSRICSTHYSILYTIDASAFDNAMPRASYSVAIHHVYLLASLHYILHYVLHHDEGMMNTGTDRTSR